MYLKSMGIYKIPIVAVMIATASAFGPTSVVLRSTPRRAISAALMSIDSPNMEADAVASTTDASLEEEFAAVSAATVVASAISETLPNAAAKAPEKVRKRDKLRNLGRTARNLVGLGKAVTDAAEELVGDSCDVDEPEVCDDEGKFRAATRELGSLIRKTLRFSQGDVTEKELEEAGDAMESGWEQKAQGSAFKRTTEVWGFLARAGLRVVKAGKTKGGPEAVSAAKTAAAEYIRDGLFTLGPTFVKLGQVRAADGGRRASDWPLHGRCFAADWSPIANGGLMTADDPLTATDGPSIWQVISTRTDLLEKEYIDVLKDLQDNVPGFGGERAVQIIEKELGRPIADVFDSFEKEPIAAASLGQVRAAPE